MCWFAYYFVRSREHHHRRKNNNILKIRLLVIIINLLSFSCNSNHHTNDDLKLGNPVPASAKQIDKSVFTNALNEATIISRSPQPVEGIHNLITILEMTIAQLP